MDFGLTWPEANDQSGTKPNLVAKFWLPNLVLYQTDDSLLFLPADSAVQGDCERVYGRRLTVQLCNAATHETMWENPEERTKCQT